ncbi:glycosyl hydrolase family 28-related protein [Thalassotalea fusca]
MANKNNNQGNILTRRQAILGGLAATTVGTAALSSSTAYASNHANNSRVFNVIDFGAQPVIDVSTPYTGVDSTAAFQAAIDAAINATDTTQGLNGETGGGVIYVPRGTYRITAPLIVNASNIQIIGDGKATTALYGHGVDGAIIHLQSDTSSQQITDCSVQGLKFVGTSVPKAATSCIDMKGTSRCSLKDITFAANVSGSSLAIEQSWINNFYDLHFIGHSEMADIYINRTSNQVGSSNALNFYGCSLLANGTPTGILVESSATGSSVGEGFQFSGITCQGYSRGIWLRHGGGVSINSFFGEDNATHIQLGDNSHGAAFVNDINITNWRALRGKHGIFLEQCRNVSVGTGYARQTDNTLSIGEATGVTVNAGRDIANEIKYANNARTRTGVMVLAGDKHAAPDWPAVPTPMGIIMRADSDVKGTHYKITVDENGNLATSKVTFGNVS